VARIVMLAAKNQADEDGGPPRIFTRSKSNIGPSGGGFGYDIVASPLYDRPDIIATRIAWHEPLEGSARELLASAEAEDSAKTPSKAEQAVQRQSPNGRDPSRSNVGSDCKSRSSGTASLADERGRQPFIRIWPI
jgi:hypothetical protein